MPSVKLRREPGQYVLERLETVVGREDGRKRKEWQVFGYYSSLPGLLQGAINAGMPSGDLDARAILKAVAEASALLRGVEPIKDKPPRTRKEENMKKIKSEVKS